MTPRPADGAVRSSSATAAVAAATASAASTTTAGDFLRRADHTIDLNIGPRLPEKGNPAAALNAALTDSLGSARRRRASHDTDCAIVIQSARADDAAT